MLRHVATTAWIAFPCVWALQHVGGISMISAETLNVIGDMFVKMSTSLLLGLLSLLASERDLFATELEKFVAEFQLIQAHFEQACT